MDRCTSFIEMPRSMPGTTLIWVAHRYRRSCGTSLVLESADRWCVIGVSSLQTTRDFVRYKPSLQLPLCPTRLRIEVCCPVPRSRAAAPPLRTGASPLEWILAYSSFSNCFLLRTEQTMGTG